MKIHHFVLAFLLTMALHSCWVGDLDDPEILYETTVIEVLCQTPELSTFCELIYLTSPIQTGNSAGLVPKAAWVLQFAGRSGGSNGACPTNVESVFAPTNEAFEDFMSDYPQWETIYDIPQDTLNQLVLHHIFLDGKLINNLGSNSECTAVEIIGGLNYKMWFGRWQFLTNAEGEFIAQSLDSNEFTNVPIVSPDLSSTDGAIYRLAKVLPPF